MRDRGRWGRAAHEEGRSRTGGEERRHRDRRTEPVGAEPLAAEVPESHAVRGPGDARDRRPGQEVAGTAVRRARDEGDDRAPGGGEAGQDEEGPAAARERPAEPLLRAAQLAGAGDGPVQARTTPQREPEGQQVPEHGGDGRAGGEQHHVRDLAHVRARRGRRRGGRRRRHDQHTAGQHGEEHIERDRERDDRVHPRAAGQRPQALEHRKLPVMDSATLSHGGRQGRSDLSHTAYAD
ncbi:putative integral membrane protein [Streptomyces sp. Tu6071]|nr:putative integral membrane protein [Streptomyces sp. Tu6071]